MKAMLVVKTHNGYLCVEGDWDTEGLDPSDISIACDIERSYSTKPSVAGVLTEYFEPKEATEEA